MFGIKRLFGSKSEDSGPSSARERFAQLEAEFFRQAEAEERRFSQQERAPLIEGAAADQRIAAATIALDPDGNRATDTTNGMAVEYVRNDYPLERGEFWELRWKGEVYPFRVHWDDGSAQIDRAYPDRSIEDQFKIKGDLNLQEYRIPMIHTANSHEFLTNIDIFIDLFAVVARKRLEFRNIHIDFEPWGVDSKFHRRLKFVPSKAAE